MWEFRAESTHDSRLTIPKNCSRAFAHEMVSAHLVNAIRDPSRVILDLYDQGRNAGVNFPAQVTSHFASVFQTQDAMHQVSFPVVCDLTLGFQYSCFHERSHHSPSTILRTFTLIGHWFVSMRWSRISLLQRYTSPGFRMADVVAGTFIKTRLSLPPPISTLAIFGNALYSGL